MSNQIEALFQERYKSGVYLFYAGLHYHQIMIVKDRTWIQKENCYFPFRYAELDVHVTLSMS